VQPAEWRCGHPGFIASSGIREKTGTFRTAEDRNIELELSGLSATIAEVGSEAQSGYEEKIVLARTKEESLTVIYPGSPFPDRLGHASPALSWQGPPPS
jgi:hypothetical protein